MTGRRVDRFREARGRSVPTAVVGRAEMRAALDHLAWNPDLRLTGIVAVALLWPPRIVRRAAGLRQPGLDAQATYQSVVHSQTLPIMSWSPYPLAGNAPTADVPSYPSVARFCRKVFLPRVGHVAVAGEECGAPGVVRSFESTACGEFPLGLGGQRLAFPRGEDFGVAE